jgi:hypothetical protein
MDGRAPVLPPVYKMTVTGMGLEIYAIVATASSLLRKNVMTGMHKVVMDARRTVQLRRDTSVRISRVCVSRQPPLQLRIVEMGSFVELKNAMMVL